MDRPELHTRQSATYARDGVELDVSTLADWVGASAAGLMPVVEAIRDHVFSAERIHADGTTVPVLDTGRTRTGRLSCPVRRGCEAAPNAMVMINVTEVLTRRKCSPYVLKN